MGPLEDPDEDAIEFFNGVVEDVLAQMQPVLCVQNAGLGSRSVYLPDRETMNKCIDREFERLFYEFDSNSNGTLDMANLEVMLIDLVEVKGMTLSLQSAIEIIQ